MSKRCQKVVKSCSKAFKKNKVTHILRPGKALVKTPKGVIPPSLCEISQNASRKKTTFRLSSTHATLRLGVNDSDL
jgi:hypothetical protein